tara:strand:- start:1293 stop:1553 length:261 start_codon:yes stop_codon:yes gene_type:complete
MKYKETIQRYKKYTKDYIKRCETLLEAFGDVPEPTEEERKQVFDHLISTKQINTEMVQEEINLLCTIEYASGKHQDLERQRLNGVQ